MCHIRSTADLEWLLQMHPPRCPPRCIPSCPPTPLLPGESSAFTEKLSFCFSMFLSLSSSLSPQSRILDSAKSRETSAVCPARAAACNRGGAHRWLEERPRHTRYTRLSGAQHGPIILLVMARVRQKRILLNKSSNQSVIDRTSVV